MRAFSKCVLSAYCIPRTIVGLGDSAIYKVSPRSSHSCRGQEEPPESCWKKWGCSRTQAARACVGRRDSLAGISTEREQEEEERTLGLVSFPTPHHIAVPDPLPPHTQPWRAGGLVPGGRAPG